MKKVLLLFLLISSATLLSACSIKDNENQNPVQSQSQLQNTNSNPAPNTVTPDDSKKEVITKKETNEDGSTEEKKITLVNGEISEIKGKLTFPDGKTDEYNEIYEHVDKDNMKIKRTYKDNRKEVIVVKQVSKDIEKKTYYLQNQQDGSITKIEETSTYNPENKTVKTERIYDDGTKEAKVSKLEKPNE